MLRNVSASYNNLSKLLLLLYFVLILFYSSWAENVYFSGSKICFTNDNYMTFFNINDRNKQIKVTISEKAFMQYLSSNFIRNKIKVKRETSCLTTWNTFPECYLYYHLFDKPFHFPFIPNLEQNIVHGIHGIPSSPELNHCK